MKPETTKALQKIEKLKQQSNKEYGLSNKKNTIKQITKEQPPLQDIKESLQLMKLHLKTILDKHVRLGDPIDKDTLAFWKEYNTSLIKLLPQHIINMNLNKEITNQDLFDVKEHLNKILPQTNKK